MIAGDEKYVALTTFTRSGQRKSTAVWVAEVDGRLGFTTGSDSWKLKRLRHDERCELQPCDRRGSVRDGAIVATGRGREATAEEYRAVKQAIARKYGMATKLVAIPSMVMKLIGRDKPMSDSAILITLD